MVGFVYICNVSFVCGCPAAFALFIQRWANMKLNVLFSDRWESMCKMLVLMGCIYIYICMLSKVCWMDCSKHTAWLLLSAENSHLESCSSGTAECGHWWVKWNSCLHFNGLKSHETSGKKKMGLLFFSFSWWCLVAPGLAKLGDKISFLCFVLLLKKILPRKGMCMIIVSHCQQNKQYCSVDVVGKAQLRVFGKLSRKEEMSKMPCMVFITRDLQK